MPAPKELLRILDANFNRAKEGLRVCEDICRFVWDDKELSAQYKKIRHQLLEAIKPVGILNVISARDILNDVGRATTKSEAFRKDLTGVFWANGQRVKESLRVLEEVTKLMSTKSSWKIKKLRYQVYAIEQKAASKS